MPSNLEGIHGNTTVKYLTILELASSKVYPNTDQKNTKKNKDEYWILKKHAHHPVSSLKEVLLHGKQKTGTCNFGNRKG